MRKTGLEKLVSPGPWPDMGKACLFLSQMANGKKFSGELPELIQLADWLNKIELGAFAYTHFKNRGEPETRALASQLKQAYWAGLGAASIKLTALEQVLHRFAEAGIDCTLVKGIAFGFTIYTEHAVRSMNDIDIWIQKRDLPEVRRLLIEMGYQDGDWLDPHDVADYVTELSFFLDEPQVAKWNLDVQWDLLTKPGLIGFLPIKDWWQRRQTVDFHGLPVKVLDPVDALVHVCTHQMVQHRGELRPRWLLDVDRLVRGQGAYTISSSQWNNLRIDWGQSEILPAIQTSIQLAAQWFDTPLIDEVYQLLSEPLNFKQKMFYISYVVPKITTRKWVFKNLHRFENYHYMAQMAFRTLFPRPDFMIQRYKISNKVLLPFYYLWRLLTGLRLFIRGK